MKLLIYKEKVKYCEDICKFISMNEEDRREFLKTQGEPQEVEVEDFASGSTCMCYISKDNRREKVIYKQFTPKAWLERDKYILKKDSSIYIKSEKDIGFVQEQYNNFLQQTSCSAENICETFNNARINMFTKPEIILTNLGYMFSAKAMGDTLATTYNNLLNNLKDVKDFLETVLKETFRTLQVVKTAQESSNLILDLKEENLVDVTGDDPSENIVVRLIDFGSCIGIEWLWNLWEDGNIDADDFYNKYIYSNGKYYSDDDIRKLLLCYKSQSDFYDKAKNLDLTAVKKIFCNALQCATFGLALIKGNNYPIKTNEMKLILTAFFDKFSSEFLSKQMNLLEQYNIYSQLIEFFAADKVYDCLQILANVLSVLEGRVFWKYEIRGSDACRVIWEQEEAIILNERCKKLKFEQEKLSFFDIANKIDEVSLKKNIFGDAQLP